MNSYTIWCPYHGHKSADDGKTIKANSMHSAVKIWAKWDDRYSAEYSIVSGHPQEVRVRDDATGEVAVFTVSGRSILCYHAKRLKILTEAMS